MDPGRARRANSAVFARHSTSTVVEATLEGEPGAELDSPFGAHSIEHSVTGRPEDAASLACMPGSSAGTFASTRVSASIPRDVVRHNTPG